METKPAKAAKGMLVLPFLTENQHNVSHARQRHQTPLTKTVILACSTGVAGLLLPRWVTLFLVLTLENKTENTKVTQQKTNSSCVLLGKMTVFTKGVIGQSDITVVSHQKRLLDGKVNL